MKNQLSEIAPRLRMIRNLLRIPQHEFARRLKISLSHYSKLEAGIGGISDALLMAVATETLTDPEWLKTGKGTPPQQQTNNQKRKHIPDLTLEQIEKIVNFIENDQIQRLAEKMAATTGIPVSRALAALARETLTTRQQKKLKSTADL